MPVIEQHDYSHRAAETENFGASISAGGNLTAAALEGDLTLAGATAAAGDAVTVIATGAGGGTTDSNAGDIIAAASQLSGQTVTLNGPGTVMLQSGRDTTHTTFSQYSESAFIGATASLNAVA